MESESLRRQRPTAPVPQGSDVLQIRVSLQGIDPPIWRRLLVPRSLRLPGFHRVLQAAMGWQDAHLHQFIFDGLRFAQRSRRVRFVSGPEALSPRERDVVRLAAKGMTAQEIGRELGIGERTVESHLSHAYVKLEVSNRVELIRRYHDREL
jgi:DNA-binding CsgD family transcriptional regulator